MVLIRLIEAFKIIDLPNVLTDGGPGLATKSMTLHSFIAWRTQDLGGSAAVGYILLFVSTITCVSFFNYVVRRRGGTSERQRRNPHVDAAPVRAEAPRGSIALVPRIATYVAALFWTLVVLLPLYWVLVTSFKVEVEVDSGPFYLPFVDFADARAWQLHAVAQRHAAAVPQFESSSRSPSTLLAVLIGSLAAYALVRIRFPGQDRRRADLPRPGSSPSSSPSPPSACPGRWPPWWRSRSSCWRSRTFVRRFKLRSATTTSSSG